MKESIRILILLMGFILPFQGSAEIETPNPVKVELIQEEETIQPGRPFWVALHLTIEEGWHVYWKNPGDAGMPLKIEWNLPSGFEAGPLQWPFPAQFTTADMMGFGYENQVVLLSQITPASNLDEGSLHPIKAQIEWLVCSSTMCLPGAGDANFSARAEQKEPSLRQELAALFQEARTKLPSTEIKVTTKRKKGAVEFEVADLEHVAGNGPIVGASFFPEEADLIDSTIPPKITCGGKNKCQVSLKGKEVVGAPIQQLKGVLVLHMQQEGVEQVKAIDIDSPIENDGHSLLSMADNIQKKETGETVGSVPSKQASSHEFEGGVGLALLFAFIGGMILNLMPCVLPVISLKILSFVKMSGKSRSLTLKHGAGFCAGVLVSFWILAAAILILRAYGQSVGWGFQLQEPIFVVILATILFVFALSLFGLFEWGLIFASWAGDKQVKSTEGEPSLTGSFFSGVLATAVATPCTGPFLGSAVGFALTLPAFQALLIFTSLGLGMCFPYLLLAAYPSCLRFIPKPGAWMETFKQLMGFILLASVVWLMWVFSAQTDTFSLMCLIAGFFCFSVAAWIYGRGDVPSAGKVQRILAYATVAVFLVAGYQLIVLPKATWGQTSSSSSGDKWSGWETFSPERVAELRAQGTPVLIDFTAKWCLICQANHLVLDSENVGRELAEAGVVKMKADWTKNDPVITKALSEFGRNSVPLYVLYGPDKDKEPEILPQVLTPDVVKDHLQTFDKEEIVMK